MTDPQLSVILASYRRTDDLALCLEDLALQDTASPFEVVLVLQAFPPGSAELLQERFGSRLRLQVVEFPEGLGMPRSRNVGLSMSLGPIVAFIDDDVRLPRHWVGAMISFYDDPQIGAVGGFVDHPGHYTLWRRTAYRILGLTSNRYKIDWGGFNVGPTSHPPHDQAAEWLTGCNMAFRREAIIGIGGFDEGLGSFWHEDVDVTYRVRAAGWKMISSAKVALDHYPSTINRPPLSAQMRKRERLRVRFVRKAIGNRPFWRLRYGTRLLLQAGAMAVIGLAKRDIRIPFEVIRGGWEGYRDFQKSSVNSASSSAPPEFPTAK